jgi:hypothetical protein
VVVQFLPSTPSPCDQRRGWPDAIANGLAGRSRSARASRSALPSAVLGAAAYHRPAWRHRPVARAETRSVLWRSRSCAGWRELSTVGCRSRSCRRHPPLLRLPADARRPSSVRSPAAYFPSAIGDRGPVVFAAAFALGIATFADRATPPERAGQCGSTRGDARGRRLLSVPPATFAPRRRYRVVLAATSCATWCDTAEVGTASDRRRRHGNWGCGRLLPTERLVRIVMFTSPLIRSVAVRVNLARRILPSSAGPRGGVQRSLVHPADGVRRPETSRYAAAHQMTVLVASFLA